MKKLKLQMQMTLDGFVAGPNGEMDWMTFAWTEDLINYVTELTNSFDTIVLGRNLAEGFIPHWKSVAENVDSPEVEVGKIFTTTPKVVFSKTLTSSSWENTVVTNGELAEELNQLKQQEGKDIIAYGGGKFVSSLLKENLIDELHLFVNPVAIGNGMPIFGDLTSKLPFELVTAKPFECGIVVMNYRKKTQ
ncbi:dihydrofolate reductase [Runella defluvii]|uniref:Dihydrofolate reductase n=1 Tax=Runella defluvii TaxID=370973 RepID=A0A7W5ZMU2_9BACT|nr:dihydrofolate reductase family protein [Runella defluvii]MBB3839799.1 dihydrofolate reductase [Runella defluvii]